MAATLIGFTGIGLRAQSPESLALPAFWESAFAVRSGGGYKDNVFLSSTQPQGSAFLSAGGDFTAFRLAPEGPQFTFFAGGDANFFLSTQPANNEYTAFAQAQIEQDLSDNLTGWLALDYFYQDQIEDIAFLDPALSVTNITTQATQVRGHTITLRPGLSRDLSRHWVLSLETPVTRQYYVEPLDDYWNAGLKLTLGYSYGHSSQLSLGYEPSWRWYDNQPAQTISGTVIPGSELQQFRQIANLTWRHHWDEVKRWRTLLKLGGSVVEENGGGFSDYAQLSGGAEIRYRARRWEVSAEGRILSYQYASQTVSATDPAKLRRTEWNAGLNFERDITRHLRFLASYQFEQALSNDAAETYTVNTVSASLQWEF